MSLLLRLLFSLTVASSDAGPWSRRSLSRYVRARSGTGSEPLVWRGRGALTNTITGVHIADVALLERCNATSPSHESDGASFSSERVLVYQTENGTVLSRYGRRNVPALRYVHHIALKLDQGRLQLLASNAQGSPVASAWGVGRGPIRVGLRGAFEVAVRPAQKDAALSAPPPPPPPPVGSPRTAVRHSGGAEREEYTLIEPGCPGGTCSLRYRRTGRCPSWYGGGLCTLEVEARSEARRTRWWHRLLGRPAHDWDALVSSTLGHG